MRLKGYLVDAYRAKDRIVLWIRQESKNIRLEKYFSTCIYARKCKRFRDYPIVKKKAYDQSIREVHEITVPCISSYESFVEELERKTRRKVTLYNADIPPEQEFMYAHDIRPGSLIEITEEGIMNLGDDDIALSKCFISIYAHRNIQSLVMDNETFSGQEKELLEAFSHSFRKKDPDVIIMKNAFSMMPLLYSRLKENSINCPLNRWDDYPLRYRGGKAFFSYGSVKYQDFAIRLRGRFLVDSNSTVGGECDTEGIMELCRLTGARFQMAASRSFGSIFQQSLIRIMYQEGYLIPFKEKPVDIPLSMHDLLKSDRAGHTFDAKVGLHNDVAELDFSSMFPWIIYNKNISAETLLSDKEPLEKIPGMPLHVSHARKGIVPRAIKPILDARMEYKKNPTETNLRKIKALKYVLVTAYGYLRFREFKLGIASSHMAICAFARDIILKTAEIARQNGFEVVHGIIDSIYIKKKGIKREEAESLCKEVKDSVGIPVSLEGIYKWIIFLPSINDRKRPLPCTYFGVFRDSRIKARGIEVRQRKVPGIVKLFQQHALESMAECSNKKELMEVLPKLCRKLRDIPIQDIQKDYLIHRIRISKQDYKKDMIQRRIISQLKKRGVKVLPGQDIEYIYARRGPVIPENYNSKPDISYYRKLLVRSLFMLYQVWVKREKIEDMAAFERQRKITEYFYSINHRYIPVNKNYTTNRGLSERLIKNRLEKKGWEVWRGGLIHILEKQDLYPNVQKKYQRLMDLLGKHHPDRIEELKYLCKVHHGLPDFLCFRKGNFMFIECKFKHEQLSSRQVKCIRRLTDMGFNVEVHKLTASLERRTRVNLLDKRKEILERQLALKAY